MRGAIAGQPGELGRHNGPLRVQCLRDAATGKIQRKVEASADRQRVYEYEYDDDGRLFRVFRNELLQEQYLYNGLGQRRVKSNGWTNESVKYFYGGDGCLYMAASVPAMIRFEYDESGNLALREEGQRVTRYSYRNTRLHRVILPDGTAVNYVHNDNGKNPLGPTAKFHGPARRENLVMEYAWKDGTRLSSCTDHRNGLRYDFAYDGQALARVRLRGRAVQRLLRTAGNEAELFVGCDQVDTPKLFTDRTGREVKWLEYDSFGILLEDSYPELFIPVGFAGGLLDEDTGLVRFGYRDYDPTIGRFTCPDPLGDTGGDHDVYDYCVDDPVNMVDPLGLFGMNGFLRQQGLKEWESQAAKVKPEHQTPEGRRKIDKELGCFDALGTPEFDQSLQKQETDLYKRSGNSRETMKRIYGPLEDEDFAKLGMPMPPKANMEQMRQHPEHSTEMEKYLPKDPTPLRVDATRERFNLEKELRRKQAESTVTTGQMIQDFANNALEYALEDMQDAPNIVGAAIGAGGAAALGLTGAARILGSQVIGKAVTPGIKELDKKSRKNPNK